MSSICPNWENMAYNDFLSSMQTETIPLVFLGKFSGFVCGFVVVACRQANRIAETQAGQTDYEPSFLIFSFKLFM